MTNFKIIYFVFCCLLVQQIAAKTIVVDAKGKGQFTSIQAAINSVNNSEGNTVIYIKKGIYNEKIFIEQNNITLEGENKDNTIITLSLAREVWLCSNKTDWGVATINLKGNDITLKNLTIQNTFGLEQTTDSVFACPNDTSVNHQKKIRHDGHQMAIRSFSSTRLQVINCIVKAYGGDTVSPWNTDNGMFYFKDCQMEGGVDFYCPRGWAYAENCTFIARSGSADIWHDGSKNEDFKSVLVNCYFDGYKNFKLGRYHHDAQFYLINCTFSNNLADKPIYLVPTNNILQWGTRIYYHNCHRNGGDFAWFANNLSDAKSAPMANQISPKWVFGNQWTTLTNK